MTMLRSLLCRATGGNRVKLARRIVGITPKFIGYSVPVHSRFFCNMTVWNDEVCNLPSACRRVINNSLFHSRCHQVHYFTCLYFSRLYFHKLSIIIFSRLLKAHDLLLVTTTNCRFYPCKTLLFL